MKTSIEISSNYGFDYNWTLVLSTPKKTKRFYLGQDIKFCRRILGLEPSYIIEVIGTNDIQNKTGNKKLAKFICGLLNLNGKNMNNFQDWDFCSQ
jgi:hypothetical protein